MEHLLDNDNIVRDLPFRDEATLRGRNERRQNRFKAIDNNFSDHFIDDIAQPNRPKVLRQLRMIHLGDEHKERIVKTLGVLTTRQNI